MVTPGLELVTGRWDTRVVRSVRTDTGQRGDGIPHSMKRRNPTRLPYQAGIFPVHDNRKGAEGHFPDVEGKVKDLKRAKRLLMLQNSKTEKRCQVQNTGWKYSGALADLTHGFVPHQPRWPWEENKSWISQFPAPRILFLPRHNPIPSIHHYGLPTFAELPTAGCQLTGSSAGRRTRWPGQQQHLRLLQGQGRRLVSFQRTVPLNSSCFTQSPSSPPATGGWTMSRPYSCTLTLRPTKNAMYSSQSQEYTWGRCDHPGIKYFYCAPLRDSWASSFTPFQPPGQLLPVPQNSTMSF